MNSLITGGSGRIGRYVVRDFVRAGYTVTNADLVPIIWSETTHHPEAA